MTATTHPASSLLSRSCPTESWSPPSGDHNPSTGPNAGRNLNWTSISSMCTAAATFDECASIRRKRTGRLDMQVLPFERNGL